jgi:hypothetical protein
MCKTGVCSPAEVQSFTVNPIVLLEKASAPLVGQALEANGIGPVRVGMMVSDLRRRGVDLRDESIPSGFAFECWYAQPKGFPGLAFMIQKGSVIRIDVDTPEIKSVHGIGLGATEQDVMRLARAAGSDVEVGVHHYDPNGHYMLVANRQEKARGHLFVFETDGRQVTTFRSGLRQPAQWVEGCL